MADAAIVAGLRPAASAARSGRANSGAGREHTETDPGVTGGDIDADWASATCGWRRGAGRRQPHARPGHRGRDWQGAGRGVPGHRGARGGPQDRGAGSPSLGAGPRVSRGLRGADKGRPKRREKRPDFSTSQRPCRSRRAHECEHGGDHLVDESPVVSMTCASGAAASGDTERVRSDSSRAASSLPPWPCRGSRCGTGRARAGGPAPRVRHPGRSSPRLRETRRCRCPGLP